MFARSTEKLVLAIVVAKSAGEWKLTDRAERADKEDPSDEGIKWRCQRIDYAPCEGSSGRCPTRAR